MEGARRHQQKNLVQVLLNEPTPAGFEREEFLDYIKRLILRLSGENILTTIEIEEEQLKALIESIIEELESEP